MLVSIYSLIDSLVQKLKLNKKPRSKLRGMNPELRCLFRAASSGALRPLGIHKQKKPSRTIHKAQTRAPKNEVKMTSPSNEILVCARR